MDPVDGARSLSDLLCRVAHEYRNLPALERARGSRNAMSYSRLYESAQRGASTLRAGGLRRGDRVILALEARPEWAVAYFAILEAGCVAVPIPDESSPNEARAMAAHAEARAVIAGARTWRLTDRLGDLLRFDVDRFPNLPRSRDAAPRPRPFPLAMLAFTSGTTQRSRAVMLNHENLLSNLRCLLRVRRAGPGDAFLSMLPPSHLFELMAGFLGPIACAARIVYAGTRLPHRLIELARTRQITHVMAVPALLDALYREVREELPGALPGEGRDDALSQTAHWLAHVARPAERKQLRARVRARIGSALRTVGIGGAALHPAWETIADALGMRLEVGYGLTESSPIISLGALGECPSRSAGRVLPGIDVRIGPRQEIWVRGPNVMRGYYKNPAATAAAFHGEWLLTGDRGRVDSRGFLYILGRLKEAIVTEGGETIHPEDVDPHYRSPLFGEHCVSALPDPRGNDIPTLFVVPKSPEVSDDAIDAAFRQLRADAPRRMSVARWVRLAQPLPRTTAGKIRRRFLAEAWLRGRSLP